MTPGDSRSRPSQHMPSSHHPRQHDEAVDVHSLRFLKFQDTSTGSAADSFKTFDVTLHSSLFTLHSSLFTLHSSFQRNSRFPQTFGGANQFSLLGLNQGSAPRSGLGVEGF
jgi:hypothetical protein